ncbi:hypothetical protein Taro_029681 [Colocasia esculenta]|uniref:RRM domain-containing protein n=1 Tax=Colocasia esculenta TaxID=4460 RepID=A0A843VJK1_COLES|nr:hypothetical protein [Colocasia esculenta]
MGNPNVISPDVSFSFLQRNSPLPPWPSIPLDTSHPLAAIAMRERDREPLAATSSHHYNSCSEVSALFISSRERESGEGEGIGGAAVMGASGGGAKDPAALDPTTMAIGIGLQRCSGVGEVQRRRRRRKGAAVQRRRDPPAAPTCSSFITPTLTPSCAPPPFSPTIRLAPSPISVESSQGGLMVMEMGEGRLLSRHSYTLLSLRRRDEDLDHLFTSCSYAKGLQTLTGQCIQHPIPTFEGIHHLLRGWNKPSFIKGDRVVALVKVIRNRQTGQSEGYGFVEFYTRGAAENVLQTFSSMIMPNTDQPFRINWASFSMGDKRSDVGSDHSIFVGDLAPDVTDTLLQETFACRYSSVKGAKVVIDANTGRSKGYGFVRFGDENEKSRAMAEMNGVYCSSRAMRIGAATPRKSSVRQGLYLASNAADSSASSSPHLFSTITCKGIQERWGEKGWEFCWSGIARYKTFAGGHLTHFWSRPVAINAPQQLLGQQSDLDTG